MNFITLREEVINEIVIKKSRFICALAPAAGKEQAEGYISNVRKIHYNATHNCYAMITGADRMFEKASDDGEPQGTAGLPMLEVLRKSGVTDILAVVTRYFGGVLLGAGGLSRAYGGSVAEALKLAVLVENIPANVYGFSIDYADYGKLQKIASEFGLEVKGDFAEKVNACLEVEKARSKAFEARITEAFMGAGVYKLAGETLIKKVIKE